MNKEPDSKCLKEKLDSMNRNTIGIIICAAVVVLVLVVFLLTRGGNRNGGRAEETASEDTYSQIGDSNLSGITTDSEDDKEPWQALNDEEYGIGISVVKDGWTGEFMEDGTDEKVEDILALTFTNNGTQDIQYAEYVFDAGKETVSFKVSDLPAGQSCTALEVSRHEYSEKEALSLSSRIVAQVDAIPFAQEQILVVDNSDDTITIMNLTEEEIPVARAFYKTYDKEKKLFVGGITYTAMVESIPAGGGVTVAPTHFQSGKSVVVGTGVYDTEE